MSSIEDGLRDSIGPLIRDELLTTWREGMRDGLQMAHKMAIAVERETKQQFDEAEDESERAALAAQGAALRGLAAALMSASHDALNMTTR